MHELICFSTPLHQYIKSHVFLEVARGAMVPLHTHMHARAHTHPWSLISKMPNLFRHANLHRIFINTTVFMRVMTI